LARGLQVPLGLLAVKTAADRGPAREAMLEFTKVSNRQ